MRVDLLVSMLGLEGIYAKVTVTKTVGRMFLEVHHPL